MKTKLKTLSKALIVAGVIGGVSLPVVAAHKYGNYSNSAYDHAKVIDVYPVIESYQVNQPVEQCWDEQVRRGNNYRRDGYKGKRRDSKTPEILGAIIGGAIGNRFGHGDGRKIATVAGAVLGGSVGRDIKHQNRYRNRHGNAGVAYETVQRCELRDSYVTKERVVAYDVTYKYRGNVFQTQMRDEPGNKIKVKVTVDPV